LNAIQLRAQTLRPYRIGDETLYLITAGSAVIKRNEPRRSEEHEEGRKEEGRKETQQCF